MKRFRVFGMDFDTRVLSLTTVVQDHWEERVKEAHRQNRAQTDSALVAEFGQAAAEVKRQNFVDLGPKPLSILAFHNRFLEQVRVAFVVGAFYPALAGACALGERILNHLILTLRAEFKDTPEYKRVYRKDAFDNWDVPIDTLAAWGVLLPDVVAEFRALCDRRNEALHFRPDVDRRDRVLALGAIRSLQSIVAGQFGALGPHPWFLTGVPGETYIKKDWERGPFVRRVYLPNCGLVGPRHKVESVLPWVVRDVNSYEEREVTDEEFCRLRVDAMRSGLG